MARSPHHAPLDQHDTRLLPVRLGSDPRNQAVTDGYRPTRLGPPIWRCRRPWSPPCWQTPNSYSERMCSPAPFDVDNPTRRPSPSTRNPRVGRSHGVDSPVEERKGLRRMLAGSGTSQSSPGDRSARTARAWQAGGPRHRSVLAGQHEHRNLSRGLGLGFAELRILREQLRP